MKKRYLNAVLCLFLVSVVVAGVFLVFCSGCEKKTVVSTLWEFKKYPGLPGARETGMAYVVDANGNPHAVFHTESAIKYASWNVSSWDVQEISKEAYLGRFDASMMLDKTGNPHIIYESTYRHDLVYYGRNKSGWNTIAVEPEGTGASLALASQMDPRISYISRSDGYIKYGYISDKGWLTEPILYSGIHSEKEEHKFDVWTALALDTGSNPHIAYMNFNDSELLYLRRVGETWSDTRTVEKGGKYTGLFANILLDPKNTPQILYVAADNGGVKFAQALSVSWDIKFVDNRGGTVPYMTRATTGQPCAAYFSPDYKDLRFSMATMWSPEIVEDRRSYARPNAAPARPYIYYDNRGRAHILYYDFQRKQLYEFYKI